MSTLSNGIVFRMGNSDPSTSKLQMKMKLKHFGDTQHNFVFPHLPKVMNCWISKC